MRRFASVAAIVSIQLVPVVCIVEMAAAQPETWVNVSPPGGSVRAIAIDPWTTTTIYMGGPGRGVFKTTDGGGQWQMMGLGDRAIDSLAVDPHVPTTVYAAGQGQVFRSHDAGETWTAANDGFSLSATGTTRLAVDPLTPGTVYVFSSSGSTPPPLYKSADRGTRWESASAGLPDGAGINAVGLDPTTSATLYAATSRGLFASTDGAQSWHPSGLSSSNTTSVVVDPLTPSTLYASTSTSSQRVLRSADAGATWSATGLTRSVSIIAIDPHSPGTLYAATRVEGLFKTMDGGATWNRLDGGFGDPTIYAIAIDPQSPSTVYAGTGFLGLVVSADAGASWTEINRGFSQAPTLQLAIAPGSPGTVYAVVGAEGGARAILKSADGGRSWRRAGAVGLPYPMSLQSLTVDPQTSSTAYATLSAPSGSGVYKTIDDGDSWIQIWNQGLIGAGKIAIHPYVPTTIYLPNFVSLSYGGVVMSTDGGQSWTPPLVQILGKTIWVAIDPLTPTTLYVGSQPSADGNWGRMAKSVNGGASWGLTSYANYGYPGSSFLVIDPVTPSTLYVSTTGLYSGATGQMRRSTDGAGTWSVMTGTPGASAFAVDPLTPTTLYLGNSTGVSRSTDHGASWLPWNSGLIDTNVRALEVDATGTLYATTAVGVFVRRQSAPCAYSLTPSSATFNQSGGLGSLTVTAEPGCAWTVTNNTPSFLTVAGGSGTGSGTVSYTVAGNGGVLRTGTFTVGGQTFTVTQGPTMTTDRTTLSYGAVNAGGTLTSQTSSQIVRVTFAGGSPSWTATSSAPWLQVTNGAGNGAGQFVVAVAGHVSLPATGTVTSSVLVTPATATDGPQTVTVQLTLFANTTTTAPVGSFDTPIDLSTGLQGSIAVTGWALDDTEVARVEIWRDVAPGETTPPFGGPGPAHGKVFIGNALFVAGARSDVEAANPTMPLAYRAGWGYLMLTWGLWAQGNGIYTLYAFAYDHEGHATVLGSKLIAVSNATATKPFGAIDTPGYGGTVSGSSFINFGWALTPPANGLDPRHCVLTDGNVLVSVDSGPLVPVAYGSHRPDIQAGFAGFSNATNAGGAYTLNASALSNGVHAIGWLATDSCGRSDGLGSRFFTVTASGLDAPSTTAEPALATPIVEAAVDALVSVEPVDVRANLDDVRLVHANGAGVHVVEVRQGDRIEVRVGARRLSRQVVNGQRRALPVGSSYDASSGAFYWQPAEGFLGRFDLEFAPVAAHPEAARPVEVADVTGELSERSDAAASPGVVKVRVVVGPPMRMAIDTPAAGDLVDHTFTVSGWTLDLASADGSGIDTVHVWAHPVDGGAPIFLGHATPGGSRPDVAATYGAGFEGSAFDLPVNNLPAGTYDLVAYAHRVAVGAFDGAQAVRVTVR